MTVGTGGPEFTPNPNQQFEIRRFSLKLRRT